MPTQPDKLSTPIPKLSGPVIVLLGFIAFLVAAGLVKTGIGVFDSFRSEAVTSQASIPAPSPSVIPPGSYALAIERAMGAAKDTQTAKTPGEWGLVSAQWSTAIDNLKRIPATDPNYAAAQKRLGQYQKNLAYADLRQQKASGISVAKPADKTQAIAPAPSVVKSGIGVSRYEIQATFEQPGVGFVFEASSQVEGEERVMGRIASDVAIIELIGSPDNLSRANLMFVTKGSQEQLKLSAACALAFLSKAVPGWDEGSQWLSQATTELGEGKTSVAVIEGDRLITLTNISSLGLLTLTVKPK